MSFTASKSTYSLFTAAILVLFLIFYTQYPPSTLDIPYISKKQSPISLAEKALEGLDRAGNGTLGFGRIIIIGLPERSDKRDAMFLQGSLTGLHVEFMNGVKGETVIDKALPNGIDRNIIPDQNVGSTRAHLDAVRSLLENNQQTALIMEDDMDWDIRIRSQMTEFAKGAQYLFDIAPDTLTQSPYGDDWDVLWLGHCGESPPEGNDRRYLIPDDPTVPALDQVSWLRELLNHPEHTRVIHKTGAPICTFAYAVSFQGAQKILLQLGLNEGSEPFKGNPNAAYDNNLAWMCETGYLDMKCLTVEPPLFFHHRPAGPVSKDSDIQNGDGTIRAKGTTEVLVWSSRVNAERLIRGQEDYETRWPEGNQSG